MKNDILDQYFSCDILEPKLVALGSRTLSCCFLGAACFGLRS